MQCNPDRHQNTKLPTPPSLYHPYSTHGTVVFLSPSITRPWNLCIVFVLRLVRARLPTAVLRVCVCSCMCRTLTSTYDETYCHARVYILNLQNVASISIRIQNSTVFPAQLRVLFSFFFLPQDRNLKNANLKHIYVLHCCRMQE